MAEVQISFITPLHNCLAYTKDYLRSLEETITKCSYEVILVDDWSTDGTRRFLKTLPTPPYRVLLNDGNLGYAKSSNMGARQAKGEYLCFLNNDLVLRAGWLQPMMGLIRTSDNIGAVGNIQLEPKSGRVHHAGVFFDWEGRPLHAWRYRRRLPRGEFGEWNAITGACFLTRASTFREFEGFDEEYINGFEDIDLFVRMRKGGYRLLVSYLSIIGHHGSSSPGRKDFEHENKDRFMERWQEDTKAWGDLDWPNHYVQRHTRTWWKMLYWRRLHAYVIQAWRRVGRIHESQ